MARKTVAFMVLAVAAALLVSWTSAAFADSRFAFSDRTVKDKKTGLMWTRDANLGQRNWKDAFILVKELNRKKYAGFSDWRLPSRDELETLSNYAKGMGYDGSSDSRRPYQLLNQMGFYDAQTGYYWSSTTYAGDTSNAFIVSMDDGHVDNGDRAGIGYVWPVRAGQ